MIYGLVYTWKRSHDLVRQLSKSLLKYDVPHMVFIDDDCEQVEGAVNMWKHDYTGGHGWNDAMLKLKGYKKAIEYWDIKDDDWLMDMDDDTVMVSDRWINTLKGYCKNCKGKGYNYETIDGFNRITPCPYCRNYRLDSQEAGLAGIQHEDPYDSAMGKFAHMSGACLCMKGWVVKKLLTLNWEQLRKDIQAYKLALVWDLVISYGAIYAGAKTLNMSRVLDLSVSFDDYLNGKPAHFFHFNGDWREILGVKLPDGRYSIPGVLKKLNREI